MVAKLAL